jgi:hypothetical protein
MRQPYPVGGSATVAAGLLLLAGSAGCGSPRAALASYAAAPNNLYTTLRSVEVHPQYGNPATQLAVAVAAQANAVRVDYTQEYGEAYYDAFFAAAKADGLSVMEITPYLHTNGTFAQQLAYTPAAYAAYVGAEAAKRCGSVQVLLIEIYNEPDVPNSQASLTAAQYIAMVQATSPAVRAACPSAVLITGGTSGVDLGWDAAIAVVAPLVDGFGVHPYGVDTSEMRSAVTAVQAAFGVTKPVYFTEFGTAIAGFEDAAGATPFWNTYQDNLVGSGFSYAGSY